MERVALEVERDGHVVAPHEAAAHEVHVRVSRERDIAPVRVVVTSRDRHRVGERAAVQDDAVPVVVDRAVGVQRRAGLNRHVRSEHAERARADLIASVGGGWRAEPERPLAHLRAAGVGGAGRRHVHATALLHDLQVAADRDAVVHRLGTLWHVDDQRALRPAGHPLPLQVLHHLDALRIGEDGAEADEFGELASAVAVAAVDVIATVKRERIGGAVLRRHDGDHLEVICRDHIVLPVDNRSPVPHG